MMNFTQVVEGTVHGVEHTHHLHGVQSGAHGCEAHDVAEQDGDRGKLLAGVEGCLSIPQLHGDGFRDHLVEKPIHLLHALL